MPTELLFKIAVACAFVIQLMMSVSVWTRLNDQAALNQQVLGLIDMHTASLRVVNQSLCMDRVWLTRLLVGPSEGTREDFQVCSAGPER